MSVLTLLLTAAFAKVQNDRRIADSSGATVSALTVAQSGLEAYYSTKSTRPPDGDSVRINEPGGYADVIAKIAQTVDTTTTNTLYVIRSTGHIIQPAQGSDPQASRIIAQFAQWQTTGGLNTYPAVFTAVNGINDWGRSGTVNINTTDSATCGGSVANQLEVPYNKPRQAKAPQGVTVQEQGGGWFNSTSNVGVNWSTLTTTFKPTYTTLTNLASWSSYVITGNATLYGSGNGLLVVTGDLTIANGVTWAGVVLVGDAAIFSGSTATVSGLIMTGLSGGGSQGTLAGAGKTQTFNYNSCNIRHAMQVLTGFAPVANGWVDMWGTY
jgi:hypothetical protein